MYNIDAYDKVVGLKDAPQSSIGAPTPLILSVELSTVVAFYAQSMPTDWDGQTIRVVGAHSNDESVVTMHFQSCKATMFGPPNDEAFSGHPLASRGLEPYGAFLVQNSSWLRELEKMNSVHPCHSPALFEGLNHFILSFHDSVFECIAETYSWEMHPGSIADQTDGMLKKLFDHNRIE